METAYWTSVTLSFAVHSSPASTHCLPNRNNPQSCSCQLQTVVKVWGIGQRIIRPLWLCWLGGVSRSHWIHTQVCRRCSNKNTDIYLSKSIDKQHCQKMLSGPRIVLLVSGNNALEKKPFMTYCIYSKTIKAAKWDYRHTVRFNNSWREMMKEERVRDYKRWNMRSESVILSYLMSWTAPTPVLRLPLTFKKEELHPSLTSVESGIIDTEAEIPHAS